MLADTILSNRHACIYMKKNRPEIVKVLVRSGFSMQQIEHACYQITCFHEQERIPGKNKSAQITVVKMTSEKTIYTYILRETLNAMMHNWKTGTIGKINKRNEKIYKDVCQKFLSESIKLIGEPPQGTSFEL